MTTLDASIVNVVEALRAEGFEAFDCGDAGEDEPDHIPFPCVLVKAQSSMLIIDANVIQVTLLANGWGKGLQIQATYDPADESAVILAMWPKG